NLSLSLKASAIAQLVLFLAISLTTKDSMTKLTSAGIFEITVGLVWRVRILLGHGFNRFRLN
ncbi:MAG: hypothetical protein PXY39_12865, partial [archaeon]|nr:hypothetical protein [archaeon]